MPLVRIRPRARSVHLDMAGMSATVALPLNLLQIRGRGVSMSTMNENTAPKTSTGSMPWTTSPTPGTVRSMVDFEAAPQLDPLKTISYEDLSGNPIELSTDPLKTPPSKPDTGPEKAPLPGPCPQCNQHQGLLSSLPWHLHIDIDQRIP